MTLLVNDSLFIQKGLLIGLQPPNLSDTSFYWTGQFDGTDLVNLNGTNVPLVSGSGLDAIYDFGVLGDTRLDKGSYIGNALALPENYNFPYPPEIYYDPTNAITRSYWKLRDFHYRYIQTQMDIAPQLINNIYFADLNYIATILQNVSQLIIYNTEQTAGDLNILLRIIGILPDYLGDNVIPNDYTTWTPGMNDTLFTTYIQGNGISVDGSRYFTGTHFIIGSKWRFDYEIYDYISGNTFSRLSVLNSGTVNSGNGLFSDTIIISSLSINNEDRVGFRNNTSLLGNIRNVSVKEVFEDYYKNEAQ